MFDLAFDREEKLHTISFEAAAAQKPVTQTEMKSMFQDLLEQAPRLDDFSSASTRITLVERLRRIARRRRLEALAARCSQKAEELFDEDAEILAEAKALFEQPTLTQTAH